MWLLNAHTHRLEFFDDETDIDYAILSHTWGDEEITFEDMKRLPDAQEKKGYAKINYTCEEAKKDDLTYAWIDTCCINKDSSAELSEAINSMYRWYHQADVCYVYLSDVPGGLAERFKQLNAFRGSIGVTEGGSTFVESKSNYADTKESWIEYVRRAVEKSRWFTRGWTLQELIAPWTIKFFDQEWTLLGDKEDLFSALSEITGIDERVLTNSGALQEISVAKRMSWAARRHTRRVEDKAYSLMGIFDINMPMLYGEGRKAFIRLQEEIIKKSTDHSIFAWEPWEPMTQKDLLLAPSPYAFRDAGNIHFELSKAEVDDSYSLTNNGLRIALPILAQTVPETGNTFFHAKLNSTVLGAQGSQPLTLRLVRPLLEQLPSPSRVIPEGVKQVSICEISRKTTAPEASTSSLDWSNAKHTTLIIRIMSDYHSTVPLEQPLQSHYGDFITS